MVFGVRMYFRAHIYIDILRISMCRYMAAPVCRGICMLTYRQHLNYNESTPKGEIKAQIVQRMGVGILSSLSLLHINTMDAGRRGAPCAAAHAW